MYMTKPTELCIRLCHCQSSASWGDEDTIRSNCLVIAPAAPCKRHEMCFVSCLSLSIGVPKIPGYVHVF